MIRWRLQEREKDRPLMGLPPVLINPRTLVRTWAPLQCGLEGESGHAPFHPLRGLAKPVVNFKERLMKSREPTKLHRKSGLVWGIEPKSVSWAAIIRSGSAATGPIRRLSGQ